MSVSRETGSSRGVSEGYENLEVQWWVGSFNIGSSSTDHSSFRAEVEPLDGDLEEGQVAELVHRYTNVWIAPGSTHDAHFWYQLGTTPELRHGTNQLSTPGVGQEDWQLEDSEGGAATTASGSRMVVTDNDVWWLAHPHDLTHNDQTNGVGLTTGIHMMHNHENIREEFGEGPIVDEDDRIYEFISGHSESNVANVYREHRWVWDILSDPVRRSRFA